MKLFNDGWEFLKQPLFTSLEEVCKKTEAFRPVGLPHDWAIYDTENLYEDATGWYRKKFFWREESSLALLRFDGVYMDSAVYVNGKKAGEWKYGYSAFEIDMTPYLKPGENEIMVSAHYQCPNSRWYSGAGIYRNVWLKLLEKEHILSDSIYFHAQKAENGIWNVMAAVQARGRGISLLYELFEGETGAPVLFPGRETVLSEPDEEKPGICQFRGEVKNPKLWDIDSPYLYKLKVSLKAEGKIIQTEEIFVGFRTIEFLPDQGFLLNGRKVKLNGVCEHHDLGCLGAAYHPLAMRRKLLTLKSMGANAVRLAHNMAAENVLELADDLGLLLVSEAFDMWESSKTPYDYARFFKEWYKKDVESWIKRDRNHPSVIMWSIGNEIYDTHEGEKGCQWTKALMDEVLLHDPEKNAALTMGSNYMPWENAKKCADLIKLIGYNYGETYYEAHHSAHPDWIIYGSETSSTVQSRGIYHFPYQQPVLADEDEQCSSLGNSITSWGAKSSEACILAERDHPYSCGQFIWTGFDYIGEPTPYHTRNSYFGQVDTAGFLKDSYYIYQAQWTDYKKAPMVHLFPYWDFNEGQLIDVRVCSNAPVVELYFDGKSQGAFRIDHAHGTKLSGHWQLPYQKGEIKAVACDEEGNVVAEEVRHSFGETAKICLRPDRTSLKGDGQDLMFLEITAEDEEGHPVENANNRVLVETEGPGTLIGLDNGDSTDPDGYKTHSRRLFGGKLLAVIKAGASYGRLKISVSSPGLPTALLEVLVSPSEQEPGSSPLAYEIEAGTGPQVPKSLLEEIPVRNIYLESSHGLHLYENNRITEVTARLAPEHTTETEVFWSVVDDAGIPSMLASIETEGKRAVVKAKSDGSFRLRCMSRKKNQKAGVISQLEFMVTGLGKAYKDPYAFVSAGLYDYSKGEIGNGNEHGIATARDGETQAGFYDLDFGPYGSDEIHLPIFALTDEPYSIRIYEGMPGEKGAKLLADVIYQKPSVWNTYQEAVYQLNKRLTGITSLCFATEKKLHLKGFSFTRQNRAWEKQMASWCDRLYGDSYLTDGEWVRGIGNNVTLEFAHMDFGEQKAGKITIKGCTPLHKTGLLLCFQSETMEQRQMLEFTGEKEEQSFTLTPLWGRGTISFVFLPGSNFDFHWFQFEALV